MNEFLKAACIALISVILCQILVKENKDISTLLSVVICALVAITAIQYIHPIIDFFRKLKTIGKFDGQLFDTVIKSVGIGILSEITCMICTDAGNGALAKTLHIMATAVIIWISLPLLNTFMQMIENILEAL